MDFATRLEAKIIFYPNKETKVAVPWRQSLWAIHLVSLVVNNRTIFKLYPDPVAGGDGNRVEDVGVGGGSGGTVGSSGNGPVTVQSVPGRSASRSRTTCTSWHLHPPPPHTIPKLIPKTVVMLLCPSPHLILFRVCGD